MVVEPLVHRAVLVLVQLQLDRLQRVHVQQVIGVVQRRFLVVKRGKPHALEVPAIALLPSHHDPHGGPLRHVHGLDHLRGLVDEGDGAGDVVDHLAVPNLLPWHGHVLQELEHGVRDEFQRSEVHPLVVAELARGHVAVVLDDLAHVLLLGEWGGGESKSRVSRVVSAVDLGRCARAAGKGGSGRGRTQCATRGRAPPGASPASPAPRSRTCARFHSAWRSTAATCELRDGRGKGRGWSGDVAVVVAGGDSDHWRNRVSGRKTRGDGRRDVDRSAATIGIARGHRAEGACTHPSPPEPPRGPPGPPWPHS